MLKEKRSQQVVMLGTDLCELAFTKREMAVGIEAGSDAQSVWTQLSIEAVFTTDVKDGVQSWRHVEALIAERIPSFTGTACS